MCGIAGIVEFNNALAGADAIERMTHAMEHRGPDAGNCWVEGPVALGHRRLSIIDLSTSANQPITDNSGRYTIVFNGEMYNFAEVKRDLNDYAFRTNGDTEVLLAAFAKWGPACINRFAGMFAFAIWDNQERVLTLMRDRLGVKPLYFYKDNERFLFASELRALLRHGSIKNEINNTALFELFSYQSVGSPLSPVKGIEQLMAGSYMQVRGGKTETYTYWDVSAKRKIDFDFADVEATKHQVRSLLKGAVERRLVSDVPVGAFLSGGIDSSAVVGLMAEAMATPPRTFTIGFTEKEFDESAYAAIVAKKFNTEHTPIHLKPTVFLDELVNALDAMDTPSADGINTYVVSKAIRGAGITVALSGIGGDELFAGYPFFQQFAKMQRFRKLFAGTRLFRKITGAFIPGHSNKTNRVKQLLRAAELSIDHAYPVSRQILSGELLRKLTTLPPSNLEDTVLAAQLHNKRPAIETFPVLSQVSIAEYIGYTQQTLLKDTDQMSMAVALEVREPFFDHQLLEFVLAIPDKTKFPVYPKSFLVESLDPLLPPEIVHRRKQGFLFPWKEWMKKELRSFCEQRIERMAQRPFINGAGLKNYWKAFLNEDASVRWSELWLFVVLEHWLERNGLDA
jgi:asparagine synthase (glutamine-hydrolysing)